jgi:hypothetical protein
VSPEAEERPGSQDGSHSRRNRRRSNIHLELEHFVFLYQNCVKTLSI